MNNLVYGEYAVYIAYDILTIPNNAPTADIS